MRLHRYRPLGLALADGFRDRSASAGTQGAQDGHPPQHPAAQVPRRVRSSEYYFCLPFAAARADAPGRQRLPAIGRDDIHRRRLGLWQVDNRPALAQALPALGRDYHDGRSGHHRPRRQVDEGKYRLGSAGLRPVRHDRSPERRDRSRRFGYPPAGRRDARGGRRGLHKGPHPRLCHGPARRLRHEARRLGRKSQRWPAAAYGDRTRRPARPVGAHPRCVVSRSRM